MVPWSIRRETDLPPNAELREMQQNTHGMVQLIRAAMLDDESISPTQGATKFVDCLVWIRSEAKWSEAK